MSDIKIKRLLICDQPHKYWYEYLYNTYYPNSPHNSKHLFDIYSLTHLFWPMLLTFLCKNIFGNNILIPIILIILTTYFEIHENLEKQIIKYYRIEVNSNGQSSYRGDSLINSVGDILVNIFAIYIAFNATNITTLIILFILFGVITKIIGFSYWIEFLGFLLSK